jgi:hypothetical protein
MFRPKQFREYSFTEFGKDVFLDTEQNEIGTIQSDISGAVAVKDVATATTETKEIDDKTLDEINSTITFNPNLQSKNDSALVQSMTGKKVVSKSFDTTSEKPLPELIFQSVISAIDYPEKDRLIVFHKDMESEFHVYNESLNSDKVRSRYASLLKVPIQDVRARKVRNLVTVNA